VNVFTRPSSSPSTAVHDGVSRRPSTQVQSRADLESRTVAAMYGLYATYYEATSRSRFDADLNEKDAVVILRDEAGAIVGFSSLAIIDTMVEGTRLRAIYSGDTIIDRAHWGTQALAFTWIRHAGTIKAQVPDCPLYWFLIVKGHRTYRYLSAFAIDFHPHWQQPTPAAAQAIMGHLARGRFGTDYDEERGVVSFPQSRGHLKPIWTTIETDEASRPDVMYFLKRNPDYVRGDELVCLTELSLTNLRPLARRVFAQGLAKQGLSKQDLSKQDLAAQGPRA
jgi:hypothetical protein